MKPIQYDPAALIDKSYGVTQGELNDLKSDLNDARREMLDDVDLWHNLQESNGKPPAEKNPLDAYFIQLPDDLLKDYETDKSSSPLNDIIETANRLAGSADRVVVLGIGGSYMGARAMFEACCNSYHNELRRGDRDNRPRLYFEGNNVDNHAMSELLRLLGTDNFQSPDDSWAMVVISKSGGTLETAIAFGNFLRMLEEKAGKDPERLAQLIVPVTGQGSTLDQLCQLVRGTGDGTFPVPNGVGGRFSVLSAVGLLPAAVLGIDVVELLRGAKEMNDRFKSADPGDNPVLDYVAACHLMEQKHQAKTRVLAAWSTKLEAVGLWYDQLLAESLGKNMQNDGSTAYFGALPLTMVNTRDLHSRHQQHQEGRRDKLVTNLIVEHPGGEQLSIQPSRLETDEINKYTGKLLSDAMRAALQGTNEALRDDNRPSADITLPQLDAASLGQLFQMLMLATALEGYLIGINPYGQPGVEGYKTNMKRILQGG